MNDDSSVGRLATALRAELATARPGDRLPSTRSIAERFGVGPVTVSSALRVLSTQGLVETRPGAGTFVRAGRRSPSIDFAWQTTAMGPARPVAAELADLVGPAPSGAVVLSTGYLDAGLQARALVGTALARAARRSAGLGRVQPSGLEELREWFAAEAGAGCVADDVIVCAGTQSAISAVLAGLCRPGDAVVMETPTYLGAVAAAQSAGLRVVPVHRSGSGAPDPQDLDRVLAASGARVMYAQPHWANPTGTRWPTSAHRELLAVARRHGCFVVEDDWAADFALDGPSPSLLAADEDGVVLRLRSLTKSTVPALRVAALVARGPVGRRLAVARTVADLYVPGVLQHAALDVLTSSAWRRHLRTVQDELRVRRDTLVGAVREHLGPDAVTTVPRGGLHLWARLPDGVDDVEVAGAAARAGVTVSAGRHWWISEPPAPRLRLSYAGATADAIPAGVRVLGEVVAAAAERARAS